MISSNSETEREGYKEKQGGGGRGRSICGCWQRPNEVYSYLLPATVENWYRVQLFSWMIKFSFHLSIFCYHVIRA